MTKLKQAIMESGLKAGTIAREAGISKQAFSLYMKGNLPRIDRAIKIHEALARNKVTLSLKELFTEETHGDDNNR